MKVDLAHAFHYEGKSKVRELAQTLQTRKMELDKEFTSFLDKNSVKMTDNNKGNALWGEYNTMLREYEYVSAQLKVAAFYLSK